LIGQTRKAATKESKCCYDKTNRTNAIMSSKSSRRNLIYCDIDVFYSVLIVCLRKLAYVLPTSPLVEKSSAGVRLDRAAPAKLCYVTKQKMSAALLSLSCARSRLMCFIIIITKVTLCCCKSEENHVFSPFFMFRSFYNFSWPVSAWTVIPWLALARVTQRQLFSIFTSSGSVPDQHKKWSSFLLVPFTVPCLFIILLFVHILIKTSCLV